MNTEERLVVVGIDGSLESSAALRWALKEAVIMDAVVEVVHCYLPQTLTDFSVGRPRELHTGSAIMLENEVSAALRHMPESPSEVRRSSTVGSPAKVLLEKAGGASLLVLGAHGRTALRDLIFGRVDSACLRHASCPVVIVGLDNSIARHGTPTAVTAGAR